MSPEQARGKPIDKRSDIWAFGCVLFEMLTGKKAFDGEDIPETLAFIIKGDPNWSALPRETPAQLIRTLRSCLEKDRRSRIPDVAAWGRFLISPDFLTETTAPVVTHPRTHLVWKALTFLLAALVIALLFVNYSPPARDILESTHLFLTPPTNVALTFGRGYGTTPGASISPDGRTLAFLGRDASGKIQIWVRPLNSTSAVVLDGTDDAIHLFWSPDSRFIGYFAQGRIRKVSKAGGLPHKSARFQPRYRTWRSVGFFWRDCVQWRSAPTVSRFGWRWRADSFCSDRP